MNHIAKTFLRFLLVICLLALVAGSAQAQTAPTVTYNSDVFQYWHLTGENWKTPPLPPEMSAQVHDYAYSLAMQAAVWGYPLPTFYSLRYNDTFGPEPRLLSTTSGA